MDHRRGERLAKKEIESTYAISELRTVRPLVKNGLSCPGG